MACDQPEWSVRLGAPVLTADGQRAGQVSRVVVDRTSRRLLEIVVREGRLLTREVVVAVTWVESATSERVRLRLRADELSTLPPFLETVYVPLEDRDQPPLITWQDAADDYAPVPVLVPASVLYTPAVAPFAPRVVEERQYTPRRSADLAVGTPVKCPDGGTGAVEEVLAGAADDRITAIVVRVGGRRWRVTPEQIEVAAGGAISLRVPWEEIEADAG